MTQKYDWEMTQEQKDRMEAAIRLERKKWETIFRLQRLETIYKTRGLKPDPKMGELLGHMEVDQEDTEAHIRAFLEIAKRL